VVGGLEAALVFLMLVMPGLLAIGGYYGALRKRQPTGHALQTLAQAIAWSLVALILPAVFLASKLASWIKNGEVAKHLTELFLWGYGILFLCFLAGVGIGCLARRYPAVESVFGPHDADNETDPPQVDVKEQPPIAERSDASGDGGEDAAGRVT